MTRVIIAQLPVSNNIAELPGLTPGAERPKSDQRENFTIYMLLFTLIGTLPTPICG